MVCDVVRVKNDVVRDVVGDVVTTSPAHCYIRCLSSTNDVVGDVVPHFDVLTISLTWHLCLSDCNVLPTVSGSH